MTQLYRIAKYDARTKDYLGIVLDCNGFPARLSRQDAESAAAALNDGNPYRHYQACPLAAPPAITTAWGAFLACIEVRAHEDKWR